jgi:hypothetical protein
LLKWSQGKIELEETLKEINSALDRFSEPYPDHIGVSFLIDPVDRSFVAADASSGDLPAPSSQPAATVPKKRSSNETENDNSPSSQSRPKRVRRSLATFSSITTEVNVPNCLT